MKLTFFLFLWISKLHSFYNIMNANCYGKSSQHSTASKISYKVYKTSHNSWDILYTWKNILTRRDIWRMRYQLNEIRLIFCNDLKYFLFISHPSNWRKYFIYKISCFAIQCWDWLAMNCWRFMHILTVVAMVTVCWY